MTIQVPGTMVPVIDLQAQRRRLEPDVSRAMLRVLEHGRFVLGPEVEELELRLADWTGVECVTCANGTDALQLALWGLTVGPGDAVIVPAFSFAATAEAVLLLGATPLFADVDEATFNLTPASLVLAIEGAKRSGLRLKAVVAVDLFGLPADYAALGALLDEGVMLVADAAQSFGARRHGIPVGRLAAVTATSFYPTKPLGCYGDGGAVFAADPALAARMRLLARHGQGPGRYNHVTLGMNSRLDTLQAAVLLAKLSIFADELVAREEAACVYDKALAGQMTLPARPAGAASAWAHYTIRHPERDVLARRLEASGVMTAVHYPRPLNRQPAFAACPVAPGGLPVSERLADEVLSLPLHPYLDAATQERVVEQLLASV